MRRANVGYSLDRHRMRFTVPEREEQSNSEYRKPAVQ
jgi:hypothetical protein